MKIIVNGKEIETQESISLIELIKERSYNLKFLAVELNNNIVDSEKYEETVLKSGDKLEVVSFVGGG